MTKSRVVTVNSWKVTAKSRCSRSCSRRRLCADAPNTRRAHGAARPPPLADSRTPSLQVCGRDGAGLWFKGASFDRFNLAKGNILPRNVCLLAKSVPPSRRARQLPARASHGPGGDPSLFGFRVMPRRVGRVSARVLLRGRAQSAGGGVKSGALPDCFRPLRRRPRPPRAGGDGDRGGGLGCGSLPVGPRADWLVVVCCACVCVVVVVGGCQVRQPGRDGPLGPHRRRAPPLPHTHTHAHAHAHRHTHLHTLAMHPLSQAQTARPSLFPVCVYGAKAAPPPPPPPVPRVPRAVRERLGGAAPRLALPAIA